jgi:probable DNA repair protein
LTRWEQALDETASLGFDGRRMGWSEFLAALSRNVEETLFAPQSRNAPIQIAGPAESAGLTADAIWFLGASEDAWPARGATNPLLPPEVQRDAGMPHATAQLDWELARAITQRLLASAPEVHFSYARQIEGNEARPSRLIADRAGAAASLQQAAPMAEPLTVAFEDFSRVPFPAGKAGGGASVLTNQSQCPFKAFATARLGAQGWEPVQAGLTPAQRGQLLHDVLHSVWGGPPNGIRTQAELQDRLKDLRSFVAGHVARVLGSKMPGGAREHMPRRYLELEGERLADLVSKWLEYEAARWPFEVVNTEVNSDAAIAGLALKLRLDRVDRLNDGSLLVIDYKSGDVSPKVWELPRPEDVQLPLYAGFALDPGEELGGLVFAKVRPGNLAFAGRVGDAKAALLPGLGNMSRLVKDALTAEQPMDWRECIEELARDFVAGRAEVDPRDYPTTCELCGLQALCRIQEREALFDAEDDAGDEEAFDE